MLAACSGLTAGYRQGRGCVGVGGLQGSVAARRDGAVWAGVGGKEEEEEEEGRRW